MDRDELMAACRALPDAVEEFPFGDEVSVFKVSGKMLAACRLGGQPRQLSLKCDPDVAVQLPGRLSGDRARLPPEQPALEHGHPRRLAARRDGDRPARRLVVTSLPKARRPI